MNEDVIKFCKNIIKEYEDERKKLEKKEAKYIEKGKNVPKRITKRINECFTIIKYYEDWGERMNDLTIQQFEAQMRALPIFKV